MSVSLDSPITASPIAKTSTPDTAESPASSAIEPKTTEVSVTPPARRSQRIRAIGVQTVPGTYFASIEAISAWSASG